MSIFGERIEQGSFEHVRHTPGQQPLGQNGGIYGSMGPYNPLPTCKTCSKEIFPSNSLPGVGYYRCNYCECTRVQRPQVPVAPGEAERLRATAALWFEHPDPVTMHDRETQYQAYKARLMLELGLDSNS